MPGAVKFKEAETSKQMALIANGLCIIITLLFGTLAFFQCKAYLVSEDWQLMAGCISSLLILFPHELLHAVCFKKDVYLYTNWSKGMMFVVGPEIMSKGRYIFMSLLPNIVFGLIPYIIGMIFPNLLFFTAPGTLEIGMGAGDYYNVCNAVIQMPKGAKHISINLIFIGICH